MSKNAIILEALDAKIKYNPEFKDKWFRLLKSTNETEQIDLGAYIIIALKQHLQTFNYVELLTFVKLAINDPILNQHLRNNEE